MATAPPAARAARHAPRSRTRPRAAASEPLLLRAARGEAVERPPVWLMRQAGRYMAAFRAYSDKYPFRLRSETPEIALELSLQPWRAFQPDGVIMFSDILTPLPALGVEFDVVRGKGPIIPTPLRSREQVAALRPLEDPATSLPFVAPVLRALRAEVGDASTVLGFVGSPWTLAAYCVEGGSSKECGTVKLMMEHEPALLHALLAHLAEALGAYCVHQMDAGAQVVQVFDSWAHHLSPAAWRTWSLPYAERVLAIARRAHPHVPLLFHANGSAGKEAALLGCSADVLGFDWGSDLEGVRAAAGPTRVLQGNVDPRILFGPEASIRAAVAEAVRAGGRHHILNVGHGVAQGTPEESVALFCQLAREAHYE